MNRGPLQSSPVQQMMAGNPNWWSVNNMRSPTHQQASPFLLPPSTLFPQLIPSSSSSSSSSSSPSSSSSSLPIPSWHEIQDKVPESWSQLLLGGLVMGDGEKAHLNNFQPSSTLENWEEQVLHQASSASLVDVKQENSGSSYVYGHSNEDFQAAKPPSWSHSHGLMPASSPKSCVTISNNMLDFSESKGDGRYPPPDRSPECNSGATGGAVKKARFQPSTQSTFKVRKEKMGDRITALHQLVSPFGKTDTASVLLEAIGYIRFLQNQIEALSLPYLGSGSAKMRQQQSVQGERNCIFPEDPGQMLKDNRIKRKGTPEQEYHEEPKKDLRSRGLCLVPVSSTLHVGNDNGADYWAPALGGGFR